MPDLSSGSARMIQLSTYYKLGMNFVLSPSSKTLSLCRYAKIFGFGGSLEVFNFYQNREFWFALLCFYLINFTDSE